MKYDMLISQAMRLLFKDYPYFYFLLAQVPKVTMKNLGACGAVGFEKGSKTVKLFLDEDYLDYMTPNRLAILLYHEAAHLGFSHTFYLGNTPQGISPRTLNQAQDYVINDNIPDFYENYDKWMAECKMAEGLREALIQEAQTPGTTKERVLEIQKELDVIQKKHILSFGCLAPKLSHIKELQGRNLRDVPSLEIARLLSQQDPEHQAQTIDNHDKSQGQQSQGEQSGGQGGKGEPQEGQSSSGQLPEGLEEVPQNVIDRMLQEAENEMAQHGPRAGSIPGAIEARLHELRHSRMSFRSELKLFAQKAVGNKIQKSWSRQNRRYPGQVPGNSASKDSRIVVWWDSSGSMWDEDTMQTMAGHLKSLAKQCSYLEVLFGDTELSHKVVFKGTFSLSKLQVKGGGGTSPQFVFDYAQQVRADGVFLITDGEVNEFSTYNIPALVGLVGKHVSEIKGLRNIHLKSS